MMVGPKVQVKKINLGRAEGVSIMVSDPPISSGGFCQVSLVVNGKSFVAFLREGDWERFRNNGWGAGKEKK